MTEIDNVPPELDEKPKGFSSVIGNRDFSRLWIGQFISNVGSSIGSLALLFFAFALTGSELAMAGLAMTQVFPLILFSGIIGVYIDRWDRKKIMILSDVVRAIVTLLYPLVVFFPAYLDPIVWLYILAFIYATANAFFFPARSASIPNLVKSDELITANSLSQMTFQVVTLVFTPLGGALMAFLAPDYFMGFLLDASTFIASGFVLLTIRTSLVPQMVPDIERSYLHEMREAGGLIRQNVIVSFLLTLFTAVMLVGGMMNALVIPFFQGELGFNELYFSLLLSGSAVSGIIAAVILGQKSTLSKPLFLISGAIILAGVMESLLAFVPFGEFIPALLLMSVMGLVNVAIGVPSSAIMQEIVEDKMRGKVFSFQSVMINSAQFTGMAIAGVWAESVNSSRPPILIGGLGILFVGLLGLLAVIGLRLHGRLEDLREELDETMEPVSEQSIQEFVDVVDKEPDDEFQ